MCVYLCARVYEYVCVCLYILNIIKDTKTIYCKSAIPALILIYRPNHPENPRGPVSRTLPCNARKNETKNFTSIIPDTIRPCVGRPILWIRVPPASAGPQVSRIVPPDKMMFERVFHFGVNETVKYRHHETLGGDKTNMTKKHVYASAFYTIGSELEIGVWLFFLLRL